MRSIKPLTFQSGGEWYPSLSPDGERFVYARWHGSDYDLFVWKPGTKEIWQFSKLQRASATIGSADEVVKFKARSTGTYYLHVLAWVQEEGGYTLKIARVG